MGVPGARGALCTQHRGVGGNSGFVGEDQDCGRRPVFRPHRGSGWFPQPPASVSPSIHRWGGWGAMNSKPDKCERILAICRAPANPSV